MINSIKKTKIAIKKVLITLCFIGLFCCNSENECDYYLLEQELKIDESYTKELLFCTAYRDFLTDGGAQDMFVLKIDKHNISNYLKENSLYKKYTGDKLENANNPYFLINSLYNETGSSSNEKKYRGIISKITAKNSFYFSFQKEDHCVESLIDENGYIVLSIGR